MLKENFDRLVRQVRAQQQGEQTGADLTDQQRSEEPQLVTGRHGSLSACSEEGTGSPHCAVSASTMPSTTTIQACRLVPKPLAAIIAAIKSELGLPSTTSIPNTISIGMSSLELEVAGTMTLKDKAAQLASELNIPILESEAQAEPG